MNTYTVCIYVHLDSVLKDDSPVWPTFLFSSFSASQIKHYSWNPSTTVEIQQTVVSTQLCPSCSQTNLLPATPAVILFIWVDSENGKDLSGYHLIAILGKCKFWHLIMLTVSHAACVGGGTYLFLIGDNLETIRVCPSLVACVIWVTQLNISS